MITLRQYTPEQAEAWNQLVANSKNATFLINRNFMDYHKDRFNDASLMFYNGKGHLVALLPANIEFEIRKVYSHHGLTYGGLILSRSILTNEVGEALELACKYYASLDIDCFFYRPIPYIYNRYPSQEDLYFLYRNNARLEARNLSQTIYIPDAIQMDQLRRRCIKKSINAGHSICKQNDVTDFWHILDVNLRENHFVKPVHSIKELELLMNRFPQQICLFVVKNSHNRVIAGSLLFDCGQVVHTQYIAADSEGKATGAFDHLIFYLLTNVYSDHKYFDFGVSTEKGGNILNLGLTFQKESFGGRGVCYDTWSLNLSDF